MQASIAKHEATLPLSQSRERVELQRDLLVQRARLQEAQAGVAKSHQTRAANRAETLRNLNDRYAQASPKVKQLGADRGRGEHCQSGHWLCERRPSGRGEAGEL